MSKLDGGEAGQQRRPAARRSATEQVENVAPLHEQPLAEPPSAQPKRIRARRSPVGDQPAPAARARAGLSARAPQPVHPPVATPRELDARTPAAVSGVVAVSPVIEHKPEVALHSDAAAPHTVGNGSVASLSRRGSVALRVHAEPVDEFGLDPAYEQRLRPFFEAMSRNYLRVSVQGAEHVPAHGRALLVSNHSRSLPWDGIMLRTALRLHVESQRALRWLVEDDQFHAPFLGTFISRLGAVRACQENAERLLARNELLAVFPEGRAEKRHVDRYKLQRFGRGGYVKLALRTGAPVIPVAIVCSEDPLPLLHKVKTLSQWVGLPLFALAPALPRLGPLGVPPVPSRWRILIGEPIHEIARQDVDATGDDGLIHELNECVRGAVQQLIERGLESRI